MYLKPFSLWYSIRFSVWHVSPEAAALNIIEDGDVITLYVPNRILHVELTDEEMASTKQKKKQTSKFQERGSVHLYQQHVEQSNHSGDVDFLGDGPVGAVTKGLQ